MKVHVWTEKNHCVYVHAVDIYWQYTNHIANMIEWLHDKGVVYYHSYTTFYFKKESDRTLFLLKWANAESIDRQ